MTQYDKSYEPPAPIVETKITNPYLGCSETVRAFLDPGADGTVLPLSLVKKLKLEPSGMATVGGFEGKGEDRPTYSVHISVQGVPVKDPVDVALTNEDEPILGRDVLNQVRVILDGKQNFFDVQDPP